MYAKVVVLTANALPASRLCLTTSVPQSLILLRDGQKEEFRSLFDGVYAKEGNCERLTPIAVVILGLYQLKVRWKLN